MSDKRDLEKQLEAMSADAARQSHLRSAADIRKRADRRRATQVVATGIATAAVVAVAWTVAAPASDDRGVGPAATPTGTAPTSPATTSTEPSTPDSTTGSSRGPADPPPGGWVKTIPSLAALVLPHDGQQSGHPGEESDWGLVQGTDSWLMVPCDAMEDAGYPSDPVRTDHRAIIQTSLEHSMAEQIAVYPSDVEAIRAMHELRQALVDCAEERTLHEADDGYTDSSWDFADAVDTTSAGGLMPDDAIQAWNWNRSHQTAGDKFPYPFGGGFFTITRVGNAILLTMSDGETDWGAPGAPGDVGVTFAKTTKGVLSNLCDRYSGADGC